MKRIVLFIATNLAVVLVLTSHALTFEDMPTVTTWLTMPSGGSIQGFSM